MDTQKNKEQIKVYFKKTYLGDIRYFSSKIK